MRNANEGNQANSLPQTFKRDIRPLRYRNLASSAIPPFACIQTGTQVIDGAEVLWGAEKPSITAAVAAAARRVGSRFIFNLGRSCPIQGKGEGTADFPCQALFRPTRPTSRFPFGSTDGSTPTANNAFGTGSLCGARTGSAALSGDWWLDISARHFICKSLDQSQPISGGLRTIWVEPNNASPQRAHGTCVASGAILAAGAFLQIVGPVEPFTNVTVSGGKMLSSVYGQFTFAMSATVSSSTAPRGAPLALTVSRSNNSNSVDNSVSTQQWTAMRLQDIERDTYYIDEFYTAENVAVAGFEFLSPGQGLQVRNVSGYPLTLQHFKLSMHKTGEHVFDL